MLRFFPVTFVALTSFVNTFRIGNQAIFHSQQMDPEEFVQSFVSSLEKLISEVS
jgi:hypothetical protein